MVSPIGKDWITGLKMFVSPVTAVETVLIMGSLDFDNPHWFAGVQFFDDDTGMTQVNAGDGTVVLTVETINNEGNFEAAADGIIQANSKHTVSWAANTRGVRFTPTGVTTATHYRGIVTSNRT